MKPVDPTLRNASVVLAGGVCLLAVLGRIFSPFSSECIYPIRGFWLGTLLNVPVLCMWCGMLVRYRIGRPKAWFLALVGLVAAVLFYCSRYTIYSPNFNHICFLWGFQFLLGILLPWDHIRENGDRTGAKSAILCVLTALVYSALFLVWQRLAVGDAMKPECADMEQLLLVLTSNVLPVASIPPIVLAMEFSFSRAGQWLGSRRWFFWVGVVAAVHVFFVTLSTMLGFWYWSHYTFAAARWIRFLVQPVTVYLMVVTWRAARKLFKKTNPDYPTWKDVFKV
jgi:hypothetical protein